MADYGISKIKARWILDSRGNPTVEADVFAGDAWARAAVPSGASTGDAEALELRDGGKAFMGKGVEKAVSNINDIIAPKVNGMDVREQEALDGAMLDLDGTDNKSKLGANAILAVSLASARLAAGLMKKPLYVHLYELARGKTRGNFLMPVPGSNVLNGGKHAGSNLAIQEFMIWPIGAKSFTEALRMTAETYHHLKDILLKEYGKNSVNVGDEGGFAPNMQKTAEALDCIIAAVEAAGYTPGLDFICAMDAAASEFYDADAKIYNIDGKKLGEGELVEYYLDLVENYPIKSIEDPFDEEAFDAFAQLTKKVRDVLIIDDDLTVTNVKRLQKAIDMGAGNALLLKVNQIGSLTEAIEAANLSYKNNFNVMVSHRSGETCDNFIADLAVGLCSGIIKTGAPCRSDRNAKYNQLLRIEQELGDKAAYPESFNSWKAYL